MGVGDTHITGCYFGGDTHITSDMCAGIHISRGYTYHCDTCPVRTKNRQQRNASNSLWLEIFSTIDYFIFHIASREKTIELWRCSQMERSRDRPGGFMKLIKVDTLSTSFPGSLILPPPGASSSGRQDERPWERGWVAITWILNFSVKINDISVVVLTTIETPYNSLTHRGQDAGAKCESRGWLQSRLSLVQEWKPRDESPEVFFWRWSHRNLVNYLHRFEIRSLSPVLINQILRKLKPQSLEYHLVTFFVVLEIYPTGTAQQWNANSPNSPNRATILDNFLIVQGFSFKNEKLRPLLAFSASSSLIRCFYFSYYSDQDCPRSTLVLQEAIWSMQVTSELLSHVR